MISVEPEKPNQEFTLSVRELADAGIPRMDFIQPPSHTDHVGGYARVRRKWRRGDTLRYAYSPAGRLIKGTIGGKQKLALQYGVFVLTLDTAHNPNIRAIQNVALAPEQFRLPHIEPAFDHAVAGEPVFQVEGLVGTEKVPLYLTPFAFAGQDGKSRFTTWLRLPGDALASANSLIASGTASRSRMGNVQGDIADDDTATYVVTFDAKPAEEDWFALTITKPVMIQRVVFTHGNNFHDGGWFDASAGKPRIQIQIEPGGEWKTVGELKDYPQTTAANHANLKAGQTFEVKFPAVKAVAVRIIGKPAHGDDPKQAFSSCAELQAY